jgi:uncharacterized protein with PIN domain
MIIDTSAIIAILFDEVDAMSYAKAITEADHAAYRQQPSSKRQSL